MMRVRDVRRVLMGVAAAYCRNGTLARPSPIAMPAATRECRAPRHGRDLGAPDEHDREHDQHGRRQVDGGEVDAPMLGADQAAAGVVDVHERVQRR